MRPIQRDIEHLKRPSVKGKPDTIATFLLTQYPHDDNSLLGSDGFFQLFNFNDYGSDIIR
jgi:hypothetical protein